MNSLTQPELQISDTIQATAWQQSQSRSTPRAIWNTFLNQVCLDTIRSWLQTEYNAEPIVQANAWDTRNGTAMLVNQKRWILIPDKSCDASELIVPQAWVEDLSLRGDYYIAVQVDPDDQRVRILGYATYEQLRSQGQYEARDRSYTLDCDLIIQDIQMLSVVEQVFAEPRSTPTAMTALSQWLQNTFTETWQSLETFLSADQLAYSFRQAASETAIRRAKVLSVEDQTVLLVIAIVPETDSRVSIRIQLRSMQATLPEALTLTLQSGSGETIQSVQARAQDESIQLQRFRCAIGTQFQVQVQYLETVITEDFHC
jgi:Protein of unknown function (DUF1822)